MQGRIRGHTSQSRVPRKGMKRSKSGVSAASESSGPIRSRPVGSDSNTDSDGLNEFAAELDMANDIVHERQFREDNKGKAKPKKFQPKRRKIEDDDEVEPLDKEALKAQKWRPMKGRAPEDMTASVAAQQMKYNPLIKMLNIKINIISSNNEADSNSSDQDHRHPRTTTVFDSRSPSPPDQNVASSICGPRIEKAVESRDGCSAPDDELSTTESDPPLDVYEELSTTASEDEAPKEVPKAEKPTRPSRTPPPQEPDYNDEPTESDPPLDVYEELSTTASEDEAPKEVPKAEKPTRPSRTPPPQELDYNDELTTTASEDEAPKKPAKTKKHIRPSRTPPPQEPDYNDELTTTASEDEAPKKLPAKSESEDEPSKACRKSKPDGHGSTNLPSELLTIDTDADPSEQPTSIDVTGKQSPGDSVPSKNQKHKVTYPRIQSESRPNLEICSEDQDAIGPLSLSKTVELTQSINKFLKPYQRDGVKFFFKHFEQGNGVILGDDMGLGKTIQVIAFLSAIMGLQGTPDEKNRRKNAINNLPRNRSYKPSELGPTCLVTCPNSVIDNWAREIKTWGYFEYDILSGNTGGAETVARFNAGAFDILICGLTYARDHIDELRDLDFTVVVVDEVQHLNNHRSAVTHAFHKFKTKIRFGLTGTVMQNKLSELHTLFDWVRPGALGTRVMWEAFVAQPLVHAQKSNASVYEVQKGSERAEALVKNCWPDLQLRRTKSKILHELPPRTDQIALCPMTEIQKLAHDNFLSDPDVVNMTNHHLPCHCKRVDDKGKRYVLGMCCDQGWSKRIFPYLILLQKVANHLALTCPNKQDTAERYKQDKLYIKKMFPEDDSPLDRLSSKYDPELCGKWKVLKPLLEQWKKAQFKVLLFSQSTKMMDILEYWLQQDFPDFVRLDGTVAVRERFKRVEEFQTDPDKFIFLASIKAAGVGLNLTAANKVVIFDPSWNPSHDAQAMDRVVRIGQKREVECIRLISAGTTEELIYHRQVYKQGLSEVANTGKALSRYFTGVQGDKNNQGDIFGVKNIFKKQANKHARLNPEENLDDFSYAFDQFVARGAIAAATSKEKYELIPLEGLPPLSQPNPESAEALLRQFGVDMLSHGEIVKPALDPANPDDLTLPRSQRPANVRKKSRPIVIKQPPLRGAKQKAKAHEKKFESGGSSGNHSDSSSSESWHAKQGITSKDFGFLKPKRKRSS
ncbi:hypothetical protein PTTG_28807 [Puccinia triticina 1-1 BBBD Race 1]|uniref:Uncharacterized protein n=1 Tax=Puccinia triticina (isolate 1-1 / race 1 (BBBD)) TaxID=630390 RepID=A0A180G8R4_PUCT1|nr:hypothetical protein PTTG_28807 [Puccinia triticina 1-1 BBBD Race 1]